MLTGINYLRLVHIVATMAYLNRIILLLWITRLVAMITTSVASSTQCQRQCHKMFKNVSFLQRAQVSKTREQI